MAPRGRFPIGPQQPGPYFADPQRRDPRLFGRAYAPNTQADQLAPQAVRDALRDSSVPFDQVVDRLTAGNLPAQLVQSSFIATIPAWGVAGAQLLIPKNPFRLSYLVSNFVAANLLMFTYDKCIDVGANVGAGIPIGGYYQEANGSISINDIWVFCNDPTETFPIVVLGYEGGISVAGNRQP